MVIRVQDLECGLSVSFVKDLGGLVLMRAYGLIFCLLQPVFWCLGLNATWRFLCRTTLAETFAYSLGGPPTL